MRLFKATLNETRINLKLIILNTIIFLIVFSLIITLITFSLVFPNEFKKYASNNVYHDDIYQIKNISFKDLNTLRNDDIPFKILLNDFVKVNNHDFSFLIGIYDYTDDEYPVVDGKIGIRVSSYLCKRINLDYGDGVDLSFEKADFSEKYYVASIYEKEDEEINDIMLPFETFLEYDGVTYTNIEIKNGSDFILAKDIFTKYYGNGLSGVTVILENMIYINFIGFFLLIVLVLLVTFCIISFYNLINMVFLRRKELINIMIVLGYGKNKIMNVYSIIFTLMIITSIIGGALLSLLTNKIILDSANDILGHDIMINLNPLYVIVVLVLSVLVLNGIMYVRKNKLLRLDIDRIKGGE